MHEVFQVKLPVPYHPRDKNELYSRYPKTVTYGTDSVSFKVPEIWSLNVSGIETLLISIFFQESIRKWKPNCACRLCKTYLQHVGFI